MLSCGRSRPSDLHHGVARLPQVLHLAVVPLDQGAASASLDQIKSPSWPQPVPAVQSARSSAAVQGLAPALLQMAAASMKVLSSWQPPISGPSDSAHTSQPPFRRHPPPSFVSEQQRTSCFSLGSAHRAASEQRPARPHSTLRRAVGAGEGDGDADGGGGGRGDGGDGVSSGDGCGDGDGGGGEAPIGDAEGGGGSAGTDEHVPQVEGQFDCCP